MDRCRQRIRRDGAVLVLRRHRQNVRRNLSLGPLLVNVLGSFVIGLIAALTAPDGRIFMGSTARLALMAGVCGGYTTFSSFSLQTLSLLNDGEWSYASANIAGSVVFCLAAVWAGYVLGNSFNAMKWI